MTETNELAKRIRKVLEDEMPEDKPKLDRTLERILEIVDPFQEAAREELDRFRSTFAELAK
jgi:N-formylglutamate amidohydrolase